MSPSAWLAIPRSDSTGIRLERPFDQGRTTDAAKVFRPYGQRHERALLPVQVDLWQQ